MGLTTIWQSGTELQALRKMTVSLYVPVHVHVHAVYIQNVVTCCRSLVLERALSSALFSS